MKPAPKDLTPDPVCPTILANIERSNLTAEAKLIMKTLHKV